LISDYNCNSRNIKHILLKMSILSLRSSAIPCYTLYTYTCVYNSDYLQRYAASFINFHVSMKTITKLYNAILKDQLFLIFHYPSLSETKTRIVFPRTISDRNRLSQFVVLRRSVNMFKSAFAYIKY
jgi:hypothetical protein